MEAKASVCTYPSAEFVYQSKSASGGQQEGERSARRNLTIFWMQAFHLSLQGPRLFTWRTLFRRLIRWLARCPLVNFIEIWETGNYLRKKTENFRLSPPVICWTLTRYKCTFPLPPRFLLLDLTGEQQGGWESKQESARDDAQFNCKMMLCLRSLCPNTAQMMSSW